MSRSPNETVEHYKERRRAEYIRNKAWYNAYSKAWRARNPEKRRGYQDKWRADNPEKHRAINAVASKQWRAKNAEWRRNWNKKNREHIRAVTTKRARRVKLEMIQAYGGKCTCCGEAHPEFLSIDHINGGGIKVRAADAKFGKGSRGFYQHLKRLGWPKDEYRLLCLNCNLARGFFGYCPHERERAMKPKVT